MHSSVLCVDSLPLSLLIYLKLSKLHHLTNTTRRLILIQCQMHMYYYYNDYELALSFKDSEAPLLN